MSIRIQKSKCAGCGRCIEACPGNLIKKDKENKAFIRQVRDCWGCTSCIKECRHDAIRQRCKYGCIRGNGYFHMDSGETGWH